MIAHSFFGRTALQAPDFGFNGPTTNKDELVATNDDQL